MCGCTVYRDAGGRGRSAGWAGCKGEKTRKRGRLRRLVDEARRMMDVGGLQ